MDWSGTLVDDLPPVFAATNHVLTTFGLEALTLSEYRRTFCLPVRKFYDRCLPQIALREIEATFFECYRELQDEVTLLEHAPAFLEFIRSESLGLYIATAVSTATYQQQAK